MHVIEFMKLPACLNWVQESSKHGCSAVTLEPKVLALNSCSLKASTEAAPKNKAITITDPAHPMLEKWCLFHIHPKLSVQRSKEAVARLARASLNVAKFSAQQVWGCHASVYYGRLWCYQ